MSYQIGIDTLNLKRTSRLAHCEYCTNDVLMRKAASEGGCAFEDSWDLDFLWNTNDGPATWSELGRVTDMGHAEFLEGGVDKRQPKASPFVTPEQVYEFDAVEEYGLVESDALVDFYEKQYQELQRAHPNQVIPGGYYKTIFSGAIHSFGWDALLLAAADLDRFEKVLDSFFRRSLYHIRAWAKTSIGVFISHDDMVWSEGAFLHPDFYRGAIFPRYKELWGELKRAGKKVLFCSDGNYTEFIDDIAEAGADGFMLEPFTSLETVVERYGPTHIIVSSKVDCRTMTFNREDEIRREIDATLELASSCRGFIFCIGNHITSNVPIENAEFYIEYLKKNWRNH